MGAVIDLEKIRVQKEDNKFQKVWKKVKYKAQKTWWYIKENPAEAAMIGSVITAVVGGSVRVIKGVQKKNNLKQEQFNKERYVYDHSLGAYLKTKRPLTNNDIVEINRRMRDEGKRKSEILAEMGLLE